MTHFDYCMSIFQELVELEQDIEDKGEQEMLHNLRPRLYTAHRYALRQLYLQHRVWQQHNNLY